MCEDSCKTMELTPAKRRHLFKQAITKTGNLPSQCPLFPGMPVKITENVAVGLKIANSTSGVIKCVICDPAEQLLPGKQHVLQHLPVCVIVTIETSSCPQLDDLETKDIPIYPTSNNFRIKFPKTQKPVSITRRQLPLVPAYSYTAYKSQAQTLPAAVVDLVPAPHMPVHDTSFAYVPLSRVRSLDDLAILQEFDISVLQKAKTADHQAHDAKFDEMNVA